MINKQQLTQKLCNEVFYYCDGKLYWKKSPNRKRKNIIIGSEVILNTNRKGYSYIGLFNNNVGVHRIIYLMHHGYLPENIDHINGIRHDNRIENLREASVSENACNRSMQKNNSLGVKNVSFNKHNKRFYGEVAFNRKRMRKCFVKIEDAIAFVESARSLIHGEFANGGTLSVATA